MSRIDYLAPGALGALVGLSNHYVLRGLPESLRLTVLILSAVIVQAAFIAGRDLYGAHAASRAT